MNGSKIAFFFRKTILTLANILNETGTSRNTDDDVGTFVYYLQYKN